MELKKRLIAVFALFLLVINIINFIILSVITNHSTSLTSDATSASSGQTLLCINAPPSITTIADQSATVGTAYTLQVTATDANNHSLSYIDNTSLFAINQSGYISFTPGSGDVGSSNILITVQDNTACSNNETTDTFTLTIAEAAPAPAAVTGAAGGGGGGVSAKKLEEVPPLKRSFTLSEEIIKVNVKQSQKLEKKIKITNNGEVPIKITILESHLDSVITLNPAAFTLDVSEQKEVTITFNPTQDATPDIYTGLITFSADSSGLEKTLKVVLEVESDEILFDASVDLPRKTFQPGEELIAAVTVFNLQRISSYNVDITYTITDLQNTLYFEQKESVTFEDQASFTKTFPIPENFQPGTYIFGIRVVAGNSFGTATELFTIEGPTSIISPLPQLAPLEKAAAFLKKQLVWFALVIVIFLLLLLAILFSLIKRRHGGRRKEKGNGRTIVKHKIMTSNDSIRLRKRLAFLRETRREGLLEKEKYDKMKSEIEPLLEKIEKKGILPKYGQAKDKKDKTIYKK